MKLEEIFATWSEDAALDLENLEQDAKNTPKLHAKYLQMGSMENLSLKRLQTEYEEFELAVRRRLTGEMSIEEVKSRGWEPERRRLLKDEVEREVSSDTEIVKFKLRIALQREKVQAIESILKMIMNRNFSIKSAIDWIKFKHGVGG